MDDKEFVVLGEGFKIVHFPRLYRMYKNDPENLAMQLRSIADAWHEGSIVSAAQAFESDLSY